MSLFKNQYIDNAKTALIRFTLNHKETVDMGLNIASSLHNFALSKSPLSLMEGGVRSILTIANSLNSYSSQFFNEDNGWNKLICAEDQKPFYQIFSPILKTFKFKHLAFRYNNRDEDGIYFTPKGQVGYDKNAFYYKFKENSYDELMQFFIAKKMERLQSKFFSIVAIKDHSAGASYTPEYKFDLKDEELRIISSETSKYYSEYLKSFLDKKFNRSVLLQGSPGSGKSTIAQTIIHDLNLRTLKFKYHWRTTNLSIIQFLVENLDIEAIILDDFDQTTNSTDLLEFLEWVHNNVKLTIATTNSLKDFHAALLRPGRIDEIFEINHLDEAVAQGILTEKYKDLIGEVKHWPVAFINELTCRLTNNPKIDIKKHIKELNGRVAKQLKSLKQAE